jgi:hypothetical protein
MRFWILDMHLLRTHINRICLVFLIGSLFSAAALSQEDGEKYEPIDSDSCVGCHEKSRHDTLIREDLSHSIHEDFECLDCHMDKDTDPHKESPGFNAGNHGCRDCHDEESEQYKSHGRSTTDEDEDLPTCSNCHGDHDILPSSVKLSRTHPANLPNTCGACHEDLDITKKHEILIDHPIDIYQNSIHGKATKWGGARKPPVSNGSVMLKKRNTGRWSGEPS